MAAEESSLTNFGLLIAYVLPGFTALQGFPLITSSSIAWGTNGADPNPSLTTFVSGTVMALAAGLTVSTVRWLVIDTFHQKTGIARPNRDFAQLEKNLTAYEFLGLVHYRYYKFYANMVIALIWIYVTRDYVLGLKGGLSYLALVLLFLIASRDALRKYYDRTATLLGSIRPLIEVEG